MGAWPVLRKLLSPWLLVPAADSHGISGECVSVSEARVLRKPAGHSRLRPLPALTSFQTHLPSKWDEFPMPRLSLLSPPTQEVEREDPPASRSHFASQTTHSEPRYILTSPWDVSCLYGCLITCHVWYSSSLCEMSGSGREAGGIRVGGESRWGRWGMPFPGSRGCCGGAAGEVLPGFSFTLPLLPGAPAWP